LEARRLAGPRRHFFNQNQAAAKAEAKSSLAEDNICFLYGCRCFARFWPKGKKKPEHFPA
jgi:hypothetical protein